MENPLKIARSLINVVPPYKVGFYATKQASLALYAMHKADGSSLFVGDIILNEPKVENSEENLGYFELNVKHLANLAGKVLHPECGYTFKFAVGNSLRTEVSDWEMVSLKATGLPLPKKEAIATAPTPATETKDALLGLSWTDKVDTQPNPVPQAQAEVGSMKVQYSNSDRYSLVWDEVPGRDHFMITIYDHPPGQKKEAVDSFMTVLTTYSFREKLDKIKTEKTTLSAEVSARKTDGTELKAGNALLTSMLIARRKGVAHAKAARELAEQRRAEAEAKAKAEAEADAKAAEQKPKEVENKPKAEAPAPKVEAPKPTPTPTGLGLADVQKMLDERSEKEQGLRKAELLAFKSEIGKHFDAIKTAVEKPAPSTTDPSVIAKIQEMEERTKKAQQLLQDQMKVQQTKIDGQFSSLQSDVTAALGTPRRTTWTKKQMAMAGVVALIAIAFAGFMVYNQKSLANTIASVAKDNKSEIELLREKFVLIDAKKAVAEKEDVKAPSAPAATPEKRAAIVVGEVTEKKSPTIETSLPKANWYEDEGLQARIQWSPALKEAVAKSPRESFELTVDLPALASDGQPIPIAFGYPVGWKVTARGDTGVIRSSCNLGTKFNPIWSPGVTYGDDTKVTAQMFINTDSVTEQIVFTLTRVKNEPPEGPHFAKAR